MIDARVRGLQPATVEFVICHVREIDNAICNYRTDLIVESSYFLCTSYVEAVRALSHEDKYCWSFRRRHMERVRVRLVIFNRFNTVIKGSVYGDRKLHITELFGPFHCRQRK